MEILLREATEPVRIWTVGHSTHPIEEFLRLLHAHNLRALADVRRFPGSRRLPQFGQEQLGRALRDAGIEYVHFPELGGRRPPSSASTNLNWRNGSFRGYADYMETQDFRLGIDRLLRLARQKATTLMCAEALWWRCHRALVSDFLVALGHEVIHVSSDGKASPHHFTSAARVQAGRLSYSAPVTQAELDLS